MGDQPTDAVRGNQFEEFIGRVTGPKIKLQAASVNRGREEIPPRQIRLILGLTGPNVLFVPSHPLAAAQ
jgi:hypothetical protein